MDQEQAMSGKQSFAEPLKIPAFDCLHHLDKRCLKPGASFKKYQCRLLRKRIDSARGFARRIGELRNLSPPLTREALIQRCQTIFSENLARMEDLRCESSGNSPESMQDCRHYHRQCCLLRLPPCEGRCTDYLRAPNDDGFVS